MVKAAKSDRIGLSVASHWVLSTTSYPSKGSAKKSAEN
jgi:hypothetical protein